MHEATHCSSSDSGADGLSMAQNPSGQPARMECALLVSGSGKSLVVVDLKLTRSDADAVKLLCDCALTPQRDTWGMVISFANVAAIRCSILLARMSATFACLTF